MSGDGIGKNRSGYPTVARKDRAVPLECTECHARYIAVLADDPPDWKPHCIECETPFGPVRGRAVYSLFARLSIENWPPPRRTVADAIRYINALARKARDSL
jgi:hypothetical protein